MAETCVPLKARGMAGEWSLFEGELFNLFTRLRPGPQLYFSSRLRVVQAMLDAMDAEIAVIEAEQVSGREKNG